MIMYFTGGINAYKRTTVEHLIPKSKITQKIADEIADVNEVVSLSFMNAIVGTSPLVVKFAIKKAINVTAMRRNLTHEQN